MAPTNSSGVVQPDNKRQRSPEDQYDSPPAKRSRSEETGSCTPESKASVETDPRTPEREASVSDSDASSSSETSSVTLGRRSPRPDTPASPPPTETNSSIQNVGDRAPKIYVTDPFLGGRRRRLMIDDMYDKMRQEHPEKWENCYWRRHRLVEQQRETKTTMNPTPMK